MIEKLDDYRLGSVGVRFYAESRLLRVVQQFYELPAEEANGLLAGLLTACLGLWFGKSLAPVDRTLTHCQDFWLQGPDRMIRLWVRFTDPFFDVIAKVEEMEFNRPNHVIQVGYEDSAD